MIGLTDLQLHVCVTYWDGWYYLDIIWLGFVPIQCFVICCEARMSWVFG